MKPENKNPVYKSWAVLTVFGIFNAALFYYAGIKSKSKKYIKVGHFYLFLAFLSLFINLNIPFMTNIILCLYSTGYIFGIFFAIWTVPEYRKRLAMLKLLDHDTLNSKKIYSVNNQNLTELINNNFSHITENNVKTSVFTTSDSSDSGIFPLDSDEEYFEYTGEKIKINSDSEEKLSSLPFITDKLIRKIILERKLGSGFKNENDLQNKLELDARNAKILAGRIDFSFENKE